MENEGNQPSRENLISFLDFVADKGLMKRNTAISYKKACSVILKILDKAEVADLSKIDLETIFQRHRNIAAGKLPPATLKTYEARTRAAINSFIEYIKDPSSWKPSVQQRDSKVSAVKRTKSSGSVSKSQEAEKPGGMTSQPSVHVDLQIHISPEATTTQIDQIFASMRRHLYGNTTGK